MVFIEIQCAENWDREKAEVDALMAIFDKFMHQIVPEARKKNIRVRILVSDGRRLPPHVAVAIQDIEHQTAHCDGFALNICVRYEKSAQTRLLTAVFGDIPWNSVTGCVVTAPAMRLCARAD